MRLNISYICRVLAGKAYMDEPSKMRTSNVCPSSEMVLIWYVVYSRLLKLMACGFLF